VGARNRTYHSLSRQQVRVLPSRVEIQNLHNDAFDVEQVTKKFSGDYTKVYFDFQEGRRAFRILQPQ
jgi:hypothetical protein